MWGAGAEATSPGGRNTRRHTQTHTHTYEHMNAYLVGTLQRVSALYQNPLGCGHACGVGAGPGRGEEPRQAALLPSAALGSSARQEQLCKTGAALLPHKERQLCRTREGGAAESPAQPGRSSPAPQALCQAGRPGQEVSLWFLWQRNIEKRNSCRSPVPTITAVGVARPRAQGQAMTRTATPKRRAKRKQLWPLGSQSGGYQPARPATNLREGEAGEGRRGLCGRQGPGVGRGGWSA